MCCDILVKVRRNNCLLAQLSALVKSSTVLDPGCIANGVRDFVTVDIDTVGETGCLVLIVLVGAISDHASGDWRQWVHHAWFHKPMVPESWWLLLSSSLVPPLLALQWRPRVPFINNFVENFLYLTYYYLNCLDNRGKVNWRWWWREWAGRDGGDGCGGGEKFHLWIKTWFLVWFDYCKTNSRFIMGRFWQEINPIYKHY